VVLHDYALYKSTFTLLYLLSNYSRGLLMYLIQHFFNYLATPIQEVIH